MQVDLKIIILASDARSYNDAYEVLMAAKLYEKRQMNLSSPALVCLAFSIELHIKLLLRTYDLNVRGHNIEKLIRKLPQNEIACISTHPDFHPTQQREMFFENIATASNLFVKTRYYFENMGTLHFNTGFCLTLARIIRKRIVERVPYLSHDLGI